MESLEFTKEESKEVWKTGAIQMSGDSALVQIVFKSFGGKRIDIERSLDGEAWALANSIVTRNVSFDNTLTNGGEGLYIRFVVDAEPEYGNVVL